MLNKLLKREMIPLIMHLFESIFLKNKGQALEENFCELLVFFLVSVRVKLYVQAVNLDLQNAGMAFSELLLQSQ